MTAAGSTWSPDRLREDSASAVEKPSTVDAFLRQEITTDRGEPLDFSDRQVWLPIIARLGNVIEQGIPDCSLDVLAGAQIGKSILMGGFAGVLPAFGWNVIYFLPSDVLAERFDDTRFIPMINRGPWLRTARKDDTGREVSRKSLHSINGVWAYVLGLESVKNAIAVQADALIYDEADLIPADNLAWSADRLDGSKLRLELGISVGMFDGAGQHERYLAGSQNVWVVKCPACKCDDQVLEDLFPDCIQKVDGEWARVCVRCGRAYDVQACGRWVPRVPSREAERHYSYRMPQLIVPGVSLSRIMSKYAKAQHKRSKLAKFRCSTLAKPDGGDMQPVTDARISAAQAERYPMVLAPGGHLRFSGIDTGDAAHYAAHELLPDGRRRYLWFEEMDSAELVARVEFLDTALGVTARVCDAKPLRNEARGLAFARPQSTWLLDFAGDQSDPREEAAEHYGQHYMRALVGRDAAMDDFLGEFSAEPCGVLLPSDDETGSPILDLVAQHLKRCTKEPSEDARGNTIHSYRHGVENHFGFAMLSSYLAEQLSGAGAGGMDIATPARGRIETSMPGGAAFWRPRAARVLEGY